MLQVGIDSYITLMEATEYIANNYSEYDDLAVMWGVLTDRDKEAYLRFSLGQIESLILQGAPLEKNQELQFPRKECYKPATREYPTIPTEIKEAQIENALALFNKDLSSRADEQIKTLSSVGAMRNIKYDKKQMGDVGLGDSLISANPRVKRLESLEAEKLLKAWL